MSWEAKIDHRLRALLAQPEPPERVAVFVRDRSGAITTAFVDVADLPRLAASPEVDFVELSRPLAPG